MWQDKPHTLVVVDMQNCFLYSNAECIIPNIQTLVRHARQKKWPIILVEYIYDNCFGEDSIYDDSYHENTIEEILEVLSGYTKFDVAKKEDDDGGFELFECIEFNQWPRDIVVCGVFGNACVPATIEGYLRVIDGGNATVKVCTDAIFPIYKSFSQNEEEEIYLDDLVGVQFV